MTDPKPMTKVEWTKQWRDIIRDEAEKVLEAGWDRPVLALPPEGWRFLYRIMGGRRDL
jgi:hypothetical protein